MSEISKHWRKGTVDVGCGVSFCETIVPHTWPVTKEWTVSSLWKQIFTFLLKQDHILVLSVLGLLCKPDWFWILKGLSASVLEWKVRDIKPENYLYLQYLELQKWRRVEKGWWSLQSIFSLDVTVTSCWLIFMSLFRVFQCKFEGFHFCTVTINWCQC